MESKNILVEQVINDVLKENTVVEKFILSFTDENYKILTNSHEIKHCLSKYYHEFVSKNTDENKQTKTIYVIETATPTLNYHLEFTDKKPEPDKNKVKEEYIDFPDGRIIKKKQTGMTFLSSSNGYMVLGFCSANLGQVVNFINNLYIEFYLQRDYILGHASAIIWKNIGIAIAGFSGMGKSTLGLHLLNQDGIFLSNDRILLKKEGSKVHMVGVPKYPRINPGTILNNPILRKMLVAEKINSLKKLSQKELWDLEEKYDAIIGELFGKNRICLSANLDVLIILNWKLESGTTKMEARNVFAHKELLFSIMKKKSIFHDTLQSFSDQELDMQSYQDTLQHCKIFELNGSVNFDNATKLCIDFLENNLK